MSDIYIYIYIYTYILNGLYLRRLACMLAQSGNTLLVFCRQRLLRPQQAMSSTIYTTISRLKRNGNTLFVLCLQAATAEAPASYE